METEFAITGLLRGTQSLFILPFTHIHTHTHTQVLNTSCCMSSLYGHMNARHDSVWIKLQMFSTRLESKAERNQIGPMLGFAERNKKRGRREEIKHVKRNCLCSPAVTTWLAKLSAIKRNGSLFWLLLQLKVVHKHSLWCDCLQRICSNQRSKSVTLCLMLEWNLLGLPMARGCNAGRHRWAQGGTLVLITTIDCIQSNFSSLRPGSRRIVFAHVQFVGGRKIAIIKCIVWFVCLLGCVVHRMSPAEDG